MTRIVAIIGTDGSGKTSLCDLAANDLRVRGLSAVRIWLGAESMLMKPVRAILRAVWARQTAPGSSSGSRDQVSQRPSGGEGYRDEIVKKNLVVTKYASATKIYVWLALVDYRLQIAGKLWHSRRKDIIFADRYVFDVCVNIGLVLGWSTDQVVELAQRQISRFPLPQVRVYLRVTPQMSLQRKSDIPDADYLALRVEYYDALASSFGFLVRDGSCPLDESLSWLTDHVIAELEKPHIHYVHSNNADIGGADKVLALMAEHSLRPSIKAHTGYRVSVSLRKNTGIVSEYQRAGIPVVLHNFARPQVSGGVPGIARLVLSGPRSFLYFRALFRRERPDLVHANDLYDFLPAIAARSLGVSSILHLRMIKTNEHLRKMFSVLLPRVANSTVSVSEAVRQHYYADGCNELHASVIHDLGNEELVRQEAPALPMLPRPAPLPYRGRLVVMVGRVEPWKAQDVFIDAVSRLSPATRDGNVFAIVGGGVPGKREYLERISSRASQLGIFMLGERLDVPHILLSTDVSVHCSTSPDPFPGVVIESMLAGAATIASASGGVLEMIDSESTGILLEPGNAASLAMALEELLAGPEDPRSKFGSAARLAALSLVDESEIDRKILNLYGRLSPLSSQALPFALPHAFYETEL